MGEHKHKQNIKGDDYKEKQFHKCKHPWIKLKPDTWSPGMKYVIEESDETWMIGEHGELISMDKVHYGEDK